MPTFHNRWKRSAEFMSARHGRLGVVRRVMGGLLETALKSWAVVAKPSRSAAQPRLTEVQSILVLRNNSLGDVLCATPLLEALRRRFPQAHIAAGIGSWATAILDHNPHVDEVIAVDAPWYNANLPDRSVIDAWRYIVGSPQVENLKSRQFDVGIDVLGSHFGAWLLRRAEVHKILGVHGYAGGHSLCDETIPYDSEVHVASAALQFAALLGAQDLPEPRPQVFLTDLEKAQGEATWRSIQGDDRDMRRIVLGAGDGRIEKYWPLDSYRRLVAELTKDASVAIALVGAPGDSDAADSIVASASAGHVHNLCGRSSLRQTFALVEAADVVVCNPSMLMHAAGAFAKPSVVLLGPTFDDPAGHFRQWCYPGISTYPEHTERQIATVADALAAVQARLQAVTALVNRTGT